MSGTTTHTVRAQQTEEIDVAPRVSGRGCHGGYPVALG